MSGPHDDLEPAAPAGTARPDVIRRSAAVLNRATNNPTERVLGIALFRALRAQVGDRINDVKQMSPESLRRLVPVPLDDTADGALAPLVQFVQDTQGLSGSEMSSIVIALTQRGVDLGDLHACIGTHAGFLARALPVCAEHWIADPPRRGALVVYLTPVLGDVDQVAVALQILADHGGNATTAGPEAVFVRGFVAEGERAVAAARSEFARDAGAAPQRMRDLKRFHYDAAAMEIAQQAAQRTAAEELAAAEAAIEATRREQTIELTARVPPVLSGKNLRAWKKQDKARLEAERLENEAAAARAEAARLVARQGVPARELELLDFFSSLAGAFEAGQLRSMYEILGVGLLQELAASFPAQAFADLTRVVPPSQLAHVCKIVDPKQLRQVVDAFGLDRLASLLEVPGAPMLATLTASVELDRVATLGSSQLKVLCSSVPANRLRTLARSRTGVELQALVDGLGSVALPELFALDDAQIAELWSCVTVEQLREVCVVFQGRMVFVSETITPVHLRTLLAHTTVPQVAHLVENCTDIALLTRLVARSSGRVPTLIGLLVRVRQLGRGPAVLEGLLATSPGATTDDVDRAVLGPTIAGASRASVGLGTAAAESGRTYARWTHKSELTNNDLLILLAEQKAKLTYVNTFMTINEADGGGDTSEYEVRLWDFTKDRFSDQVHWVVHIHRGKGVDRTSAVHSAAHLKRFKERKLKDAHRWPVSSDVVIACRAVTK